MKYIRFFSGLFLIALIFFGWGFWAAESETFPQPVIKKTSREIIAFVKGGEADKKTLGEKLANDAGLRPERAMVGLRRHDKRDYKPLNFKKFKKRRLSPLVFSEKKEAIPPGYLLVWGAFDFKEHLHGGILIDHKGRVRHRWIVDEKAIKNTTETYNQNLPENNEKISYKPPELRIPHGLAVFPDGALLFNDGDPGNGMQKIDLCSDSVWVKLGEFNHVLTSQQTDHSVWTMEGGENLHKIDPETGETLRIIKVYDIMSVNSAPDLLSIRRNRIDGKWLADPWHFNDIEPLPEIYEDAFPQFSAGDLLLSMRSLNGLMVIDPATLQMKWWRTGAVCRQHDPDWQANGRITVYDNQMRDTYDGPPRFSRIVSLDVNTYETSVLYQGQRDGFYSKIMGKHQVLPNGNILITSPMQGRILITDPRGKTVFELLNRYDEKNTLKISEALWLPADFFNFPLGQKDCPFTAKEPRRPDPKDPHMPFHYPALHIELNHNKQNLKLVPTDILLPFRQGPLLAFEGWSAPEKSFVWTEGNSAALYFRLPAEFSKSGGRIALVVHTMGSQRIHAYFNNQLIGRMNKYLSTNEWLAFDLPADAVKPLAANQLRFELPDARSPDSPDPRILAMALTAVKFSLQGQ